MKLQASSKRRRRRRDMKRTRFKCSTLAPWKTSEKDREEEEDEEEGEEAEEEEEGGEAVRRTRKRERDLPLCVGAFWLLLVTVSLLVASSARCQRQPTTQTSDKWPSVQLVKLGLVRGVRFEPPVAAGGGELPPVAGFLGLPYAGAPLGPLRFMPPPGHQSGWDSGGQRERCPLATGNNETSLVRVHAKFGPECVRLADWLTSEQAFEANEPNSAKRSELQSEDCLNLNVFVPLESTNLEPARQESRGALERAKQHDDDEQQIKSNYPFQAGLEPRASGADNHQASATMQANANKAPDHSISQAIQVRGFLPFVDLEAGSRDIEPKTSSSASSGTQATLHNHAIWDQIGLLHWLKRNIGAFGGDPSNISLISADNNAANQLELLSTCPLAKGLFKRLVLVHNASDDETNSSGSINQLLKVAAKSRRARGKLSDELSLVVRKLLQQQISERKNLNNSKLLEEIDAGNELRVFEFIQSASLQELAQIEQELGRLDQRLLSFVSEPNLDDRLLFPHFASMLRPLRAQSSTSARYKPSFSSVQVAPVSWIELVTGQQQFQGALVGTNNATAHVLQKIRDQADYCAYLSRLYAGLDELKARNSSLSMQQIDPIGLLPRLGDLQLISNAANESNSESGLRRPTWRHEPNKSQRGPSVAQQFRHLKQVHLLNQFLVQKPRTGQWSKEAIEEQFSSGVLAQQRQQRNANRSARAHSSVDNLSLVYEFERLVESLASFELVAIFIGNPMHNSSDDYVSQQAHANFGHIVKTLELLNGRQEFHSRLLELIQLADLHWLAGELLASRDKTDDTYSCRIPSELIETVGSVVAHNKDLWDNSSSSSSSRENENRMVLIYEEEPVVRLDDNWPSLRFLEMLTVGNKMLKLGTKIRPNVRLMLYSTDDAEMKRNSLLRLAQYRLDLLPFLAQLGNETGQTTGEKQPDLVYCLNELDSILAQSIGGSKENALALGVGQLVDPLILGGRFSEESQCLLNTTNRLRKQLRSDLGQELEFLLAKLIGASATVTSAATASVKQGFRPVARVTNMTTRNLVNQSEGMAYLEQELAHEQQTLASLRGLNNGLSNDDETRPASLRNTNSTGGGGLLRNFLASSYKDAVGQALAVVVGTGLLIFLLNLLIVVTIALRSARNRRPNQLQQRPIESATHLQQTQELTSGQLDTKSQQASIEQQQQPIEFVGVQTVGRKSTLKRHTMQNGAYEPCTQAALAAERHPNRSIKFDLSGVEQQDESVALAQEQTYELHQQAELDKQAELYLSVAPAAQLMSRLDYESEQQQQHQQAQLFCKHQQPASLGSTLGGSLTSPFESQSQTTSSSAACRLQRPAAMHEHHGGQPPNGAAQNSRKTCSVHHLGRTVASSATSPSLSATLSNATPVQELNNEQATAEHSLSIGLLFPTSHENHNHHHHHHHQLEQPMSSTFVGQPSSARQTKRTRRNQQQQQLVQLVPFEGDQQQHQQTIYYLQTGEEHFE